MKSFMQKHLKEENLKTFSQREIFQKRNSILKNSLRQSINEEKGRLNSNRRIVLVLKSISQRKCLQNLTKILHRFLIRLIKMLIKM